MGFSKKKLSKLARKLRRLKLGKKGSNDMLDPKKAVDVTFNLDDSQHDADHPREEIELEPHEINIGASLLDAELDLDERKMVPPSSRVFANTKRSERKSIKFGFSENIEDGKSGFSMRVILMGAAAAPAQKDSYNMTESDVDLIGTVVGGRGYEDDSVNSNVSNISGTTNFLPPVAPIDGRLFDIMDLERADDSYYFKRMNSWDVALAPFEDGEGCSQQSFEVSTLADGELTDIEKADMMKESCMYCVAPSAAVLTTTTCAAAAAMALL
mmetsp:Transcript_18637/g.30937  ORF Transcript_18637/g.30937 Transcript_18637/m.30937 type:complete len:269 (-) Transcript_18637:45-851(-)|eukprot:CAMPEP_0197720362 /NCGR_PEP_ID=MMETSP1434-20131217/3752_1 /TAXON_ID=265543 /ORGANISM="Minutocellus polymorphus, Strain CCMP3303" /LENGTH=268 /DNA_ID=CAMNT_0043305215 /DNA_START=56 /DNA_END=862 /DNA_ORIENTATION=+